MQLKLKDQKVLAVAAHADDIEIGCYGTLAKFERLGADIYYVVFSCRMSATPDKFTKEDVLKEMKKSCQILNIKNDHQFIYDFKNRHFPEHRQEILQILIDLKNRINPRIVLTHSDHDCHQDHHVMAKESFRAFRNETILRYELNWNRSIIHKNFFIVLNKHDLEKKIQANKGFFTQRGLPDRGVHFKREIIMANAVINGSIIGRKYAECFETNRLIESQ